MQSHGDEELTSWIDFLHFFIIFANSLYLNNITVTRLHVYQVHHPLTNT